MYVVPLYLVVPMMKVAFFFATCLEMAQALHMGTAIILLASAYLPPSPLPDPDIADP
jgi:hypothetical protein